MHLILFLLSICKLGLFNLKLWIVVNMERSFMSVMFIHLQFYFRNYFFTRADFSFDWLFFIKSIWWNQTNILNIKPWVCCYYGEKNDRNLKNILLTHAIRTTTLFTPKCRPALPTPNFYGPMPPTPNFRPKLPAPFFWPTPKSYRPTPPTPKFDPRHPCYPRYLTDSFLCNITFFCAT